MSVILGYKKLKRMASGSSDFLYKDNFYAVMAVINVIKNKFIY